MSSAVKNWAFGLKGKTLGGRYVLGDVIGVGGMGAVFQGVHKRVGRPVAIKLLVPDLSEDRETSLRFQQEARAAAQIARKGVVEILDFDDDDEFGSFLVMELLRGESLSKRIKRRGQLEIVEALSIGLQVVDALASVHSKGIVHRDLKPANVFMAITEDGDEVVKLLDFGISRVHASSKATQLTKPGVLLGTPRYMSPEQAWCKPDVDHRTDLYAIGAILYHALSGVKPYQDLPPGRLLEAVLKWAPKPLREVCPDLPESVHSLIGSAMERERDQRFQTADAMRVCLMDSLEELARTNAVVTGESSEESSAFVGVTFSSLGETIAMEPPSMEKAEPSGAPVAIAARVLSVGGPSDGSGAPAQKLTPPVAPDPPVFRLTPTPPVPEDLGRTTPGYLAQRPAPPAAGGPPAQRSRTTPAPPPGAPNTQAGFVDLGGPTVAYDSGAYQAAQSAGAHPTPAPDPDMAKTTLVAPPSEQRPSQPPSAVGTGSQPSLPVVGTGSQPSRPAERTASEPSLPVFRPVALDQPVPPSGSFDAVPQPAPRKKRSAGKVVLIVLLVLGVLVAGSLGGLWLALDQGWVRDPRASSSSAGGAASEPGSRGTKRPTPEPAGPENVAPPPVSPTPPVTPDANVAPLQPQASGSKVGLWRSEVQIARNEREVGRGQRARERLLAVIDAVEQARPGRDSEEAQAGVEACLLLGEIDMASIGTGGPDAITYLEGVSVQIQTVTDHYQRAWRLGVNQLEQCVYAGMARAAERASEACGRAAQTHGLDAAEVARRQAEAQRYLGVARDHYQRAQNVRDSECRDQVAAGLVRVNAAPTAPQLIQKQPPTSDRPAWQGAIIESPK